MAERAFISDVEKRAEECPVCDYPQARFHAELADRLTRTSQEKFPLYLCSSCGSLFQEAEKIRHRLVDFYPRGYWWEDLGALSSVERFYREWVVRHDQLRFLKSVVAVSQMTRILDIGCGNGVFVKLANQGGYEAYGLESVPEPARLAELNAPGKIYCGSEDELIEAGELFDVVVLFHCLEHLLDPFKYLKRIQSLIRRPGGLIVQVPNIQSLQARIFKSHWYGLDCPRHVCNYTDYSLLHLLVRCGFRIERVRHFSLRDNAAALVSSTLPRLDPIARRIRNQGRSNGPARIILGLSEVLYFTLVLSAQPFAWLESKLGRGGTLTVYATLEG